jgi:hypothetical protein
MGFPPAAELLRQVLELRVHVLLRDDRRAEDALVEATVDRTDPRDVMLAVQHGAHLTA